MERFLGAEELAALGLAGHGRDVCIDRAAIIVNPQFVTLGSRVRIDAFALLVAGLEGLVLGSNVHIGASAQIFGHGAGGDRGLCGAFPERETLHRKR